MSEPCRRCNGSGVDFGLVGVGRIVREKRKKLGLTMAEASRQAGITQAYASDLERDCRRWGNATSARYAAVMGIRLNDLAKKV